MPFGINFPPAGVNVTRRRRSNPLGVLLLLPIGIVTGLIGFFMLLSHAALVANGGRATATVVDNRVDVQHEEARTDDDGHYTPARDVTYYFPIISFKTEDGKDVTVDTHAGTTSRATVGSTRAIIYDKGDPQRTVKDSSFSLWIFPLILIAVGLLALAISIFAIIALKRAAKAIMGAVQGGQAATQAAAGSFVAAPGAPAAAGGFMPNAGALFGAPLAPPVPPSPVNPQLAEFVRQARATGTTDEAIRQTLVSTGWNAADVDLALR